MSEKDALERFEIFLHEHGERLKVPESIEGSIMLAVEEFVKAEIAPLHSPALTQALETADNIKGLSIKESIAVKAIVIALREARNETDTE